MKLLHTTYFLLINDLDSLRLNKLFFRFTIKVHDLCLYVFIRITAAPQTTVTLTAQSVLSALYALDKVSQQPQVKRKFP